MKKLKTLIAALMAATMVLTMTGCDEEAGPGPAGDGGGSAPTQGNTPNGESSTVSAENFEMDDEDVENAAKALKDQLSYPDLKVEKRIKWMAWWLMDETSGEALLFKEAYGIPATGDSKEDEGRIFENTVVDYGSRYDALSTAIASDESPDLFPFEMTDFPYGVLMNRYQSVDDIIDFSEPKWAAHNDLNDQFVLNGKHYTAFWSNSLADLMWYKKSNIESIGADDPQELFREGNWNWDTFLDIARKWQQSGSTDTPRFVTDGWSVESNLMVTTGVPMVVIKDGKLVSNLRTSEMERAVTGIIETLQKENLRYPRHELNEWQQNPTAWASDQTLFFCEGVWRYEEDLQNFKRRFKWADDEIRVVPYPKDPKADKYYVQIKVDVPMWVKGSTNAAGVQAWLDCCITCAQDKTLHEASNAKMIKNPKQGYTQEILDFLDYLYGYNGDSPLTPIADFRTGLGPNAVGQGNTEDPVNACLSIPYLTGEDSFVTLRDANEGIILQAIKDINDRI